VRLLRSWAWNVRNELQRQRSKLKKGERNESQWIHIQLLGKVESSREFVEVYEPHQHMPHPAHIFDVWIDGFGPKLWLPERKRQLL
jgi:hypothetical protein